MVEDDGKLTPLTEVEEAVRQAALRGEQYKTGWTFGFALRNAITASSTDGHKIEDPLVDAMTSPITESPLRLPDGPLGKEPSAVPSPQPLAEEDSEGPKDEGEAEEEEIECAFFRGRARPLEEAPSVSAAFIRRFLLGHEPELGQPIQGLDLSGLRITGKLSLNHARNSEGGALPGLIFRYCHFGDTVYAQGARLDRLEFWDCLVPSIDAEFLSLDGPFALYDTIITRTDMPTISLAWAQIGGALGASGINARRGVPRLRIELFQANVRGIVTFEGSGNLLDADSFALGLNISDSHFGTAVNLNNSVFAFIDADDCRADSIVSLMDSVVLNRLSFARAQIAGDFRCDRLNFLHDADRFRLVGGRIGGSWLMRRATIFGCIEMMACQIEGGWELDGSRLTARQGDGITIAAREAKFGGSVWMRSQDGVQFESHGHINLRRARIEGDLQIRGATCRAIAGGAAQLGSSMSDACIYARAMYVAGDLQLGDLKDRSSFEGPVLIDRVDIRGDLDITGAAFGNVDPPTALLSMRDGQVAGHLRARGFAEEPMTKGIIDLTGLHVGVLSDNDGEGWGRRSKKWWRTRVDVRLRLNGFTYDRLDSKRRKGALWEQRQQWLLHQDLNSEGNRVFQSQPYEQLARALRADGWEEDARQIALLKRVERRRLGNLSTGDWMVSLLYGVTFGYGLSPFRAGRTLIGYWALGVIGLWIAFARNKIVVLSGAAEGMSPCPSYRAALHAMQLMVPLPNLSGGKCGIDPNDGVWKALEFGYGVGGAVLLALAVVTFSGVTRNEFSR